MEQAIGAMGRRIVEAARLAMRIHLERSGVEYESTERREAVGGAGASLSTDGPLLHGDGRHAGSSFAEGRRS